MADCDCRECRKIAHGLLSLWWDDLYCLTRHERLCLGWYAGILLIPLAAVFMAWLFYGPELEQVLKFGNYILD